MKKPRKFKKPEKKRKLMNHAGAGDTDRDKIKKTEKKTTKNKISKMMHLYFWRHLDILQERAQQNAR